jgi:ketosteroid isomerase-like protein
MSRNLELVRSICAAWERGDFTSVGWAHPDIEFVIADGPEPGLWTGRTGMGQRMRDWLSVWEDWRTEAEEFRELDAERVLVLLQFSGRGKTSGLAVGQMRAEVAHLFHLRAGKVTRSVIYFNRENAVADLGLAE